MGGGGVNFVAPPCYFAYLNLGIRLFNKFFHTMVSCLRGIPSFHLEVTLVAGILSLFSMHIRVLLEGHFVKNKNVHPTTQLVILPPVGT